MVKYDRNGNCEWCGLPGSGIVSEGVCECLDRDENPWQMVARLNATSKERALTTAESMLLERAINIVDGNKQPHGINRALARKGVKRDMRHLKI